MRCPLTLIGCHTSLSVQTGQIINTTLQKRTFETTSAAANTLLNLLHHNKRHKNNFISLRIRDIAEFPQHIFHIK